MKPAWIVYGVHGVLLLAQVLLLRDIGNSISPTVDAPHHFAIGLMTLGTGDVRYCHDDPPLQNYLNALPVFLMFDPQLPVESWAWREAKHLYSIAREVLHANRDQYLAMVSVARWGTIFLSAFLSVLVFWWAKIRLGNVPALVAQAVLTFEPNLLAHGCLVTTDMGAVATFFAAAAAIDWFVRVPSVRRFLLVGLAVGIAWLAKHAAIVLFPLFWILARSTPEVRRWVGPAGDESNENSNRLSREIRCVGLVFPLLVAALGVVWMGYGLEIGDSRTYLAPGDSRHVCDLAATMVLRIRTLWPGEALTPDEEMNVREKISSFLRRYLPAFSHFEGILVQRAHARGGHPVYFRGRFSTSGWWDFYPTLFLVKSTLPFLVLVGVGAWAVFSRNPWRDPTRRFLWVAPLVYGVVLVAVNRAQIGYRHAMPMLPFLILWIGLAVREVFIFRAEERAPTPLVPSPKPVRRILRIHGEGALVPSPKIGGGLGRGLQGFVFRKNLLVWLGRGLQGNEVKSESDLPVSSPVYGGGREGVIENSKSGLSSPPISQSNLSQRSKAHTNAPTPALPVNGEGALVPSPKIGGGLGRGLQGFVFRKNLLAWLGRGLGFENIARNDVSSVSPPVRIAVLLLLLVGHAFSVLRHHPFELTYYNEPAGGPAAALMWAVDSNADWGQALPQLEEYVRNHGIERVRLIYFGVPELVDLYAIPYEQATVSRLHDPGYVAISLTALTGIPHQLSVRALQPFWDAEPVARLGNAIYLYRLPE